MAKLGMDLVLDTDKKTGKVRHLKGKEEFIRFSVNMLDDDGDVCMTIKGFRTTPLFGRVIPPSITNIKGTLYIADMSRGFEDKMLRLLQELWKDANK